MTDKPERAPRGTKRGPSSSSSSSTTGGKSESLLLASALNQFSKSSDALLKHFEDIKNTREQILANLELEISQKRKERDVLEEESAQEIRFKRIKMDQDLQEHGFTAAEGFLKNKGMVAVCREDYEKLRSELDLLRHKDDEELKQAVLNERKVLQTEYRSDLNTANLKHAAETAKATAQIEQQYQTIEYLKSELKQAEKRLDEQRELTKEVAVASKQPSIVQNLSK